MLDFKALELTDKAWVDPLVFAENSPSADFNFGNMYMWDGRFRQGLCQYGGRLVVRPLYSSHPFFAWPVGHGELKPVLDKLEECARRSGHPFMLRGVTAENLPLLEELYPGRLQVQADRDYWDYIYDIEKLATLSGKKLHGQRNHCNRFEKENDWQFSPMTAADIPACRDFLAAWVDSLDPEERPGVQDECAAIERGFAAFEALGLEGGILRANGRTAGFTMGEKISADTFNVHFEKALRDMPGAYSMVNREFARQIRSAHPEILWLNREDDTGRESLRRAKLSYHPARMVEKHTVVISYD